VVWIVPSKKIVFKSLDENTLNVLSSPPSNLLPLKTATELESLHRLV